MLVVLYVRVSTNDKDQNPETQLLALRQYCKLMGWTIAAEYVDTASANDFGHRTEWRRMNDDAARRKFKAVVVWKLDRAFRSVRHMHQTLEAWELLRVAFISQREGFDTTTPIGRLMMNLLASIAEFELEMIRDRVVAGMDRARRQGKQIGRPRVQDRRGFRRRFGEVLARMKEQEITLAEAAKDLGIGRTTLRRLIKECAGNEFDG